MVRVFYMRSYSSETVPFGSFKGMTEYYGLTILSVETNVKVKDVGDLDADSKTTLSYYFRKVFHGEDDERDDTGYTPRLAGAVLTGVGAAHESYSVPGMSRQQHPAAAALGSENPEGTNVMHYVNPSASPGYYNNPVHGSADYCHGVPHSSSTTAYR